MGSVGVRPSTTGGAQTQTFGAKSPLRSGSGGGGGGAVLGGRRKSDPAVNLGFSSAMLNTWVTTNKAAMEGGLQRREKIMRLAESAATLQARKLAKRNMILEERARVQQKLESIDYQRKQLIEDYKMRHQKDL